MNTEQTDDHFKSFDIYVTTVLAVKGTDYYASEWDGDEEAFRAELTKLAVKGMRNGDLDIADAWLDHIQETDDA